MSNELKAYLSEEDGVSTVEIVLILLVLIALVLIFKEQLTKAVEIPDEQSRFPEQQRMKRISGSTGFVDAARLAAQLAGPYPAAQFARSHPAA